MRRSMVIATAALAALSSVSVVGSAAGVGETKTGKVKAAEVSRYHRGAEVEQVPISFRVRNVNRSKVSCASDGRTYTVRGHLVAPRHTVSSRHAGAATLYLHGLSFGEFFWNYQGARGYNYAVNQARRGNASVVIDRIGYVSSDKPNGYRVCVGSRADMAHQMVTALRTGRYSFDGGHAPRFGKVVLAGHSYGSQIAQVEAYSFGDIDGLVVMSYSDRVQSARLQRNAAYNARVCAHGGVRVGGVGPRGYAPFGRPSGADASLFHSTPPRVERAVLQLLTVDPCGDTASFKPAVKVDLANLHRVKVPVLIITGASDALFPPPAGPNQARLFSGSRSVTQTTLPGTAHAVTFERTHYRLVRVVDYWLHRHIEHRWHRG